ncbi:MAG: PQQ-dependent sugar dehydrogenase [Gemmatimonadetes bacterium]|nr:PQQ-dependent sugar dehydrogenase [Gemmatimonadota bacterium]
MSIRSSSFVAVAAVSLSASLVASVAAAQANVPADVQRSALHSYRVTRVADGFVNPWSIAFVGNDLLVTERPGRLRIVRNGQLLPDSVPGLPPIRTGGQGGLLDVVPHPNFATNRLVYISYSKPNADGTQGTTAVIRGRFENDRLSNVEEIFEAQVWSPGRGHHGSRLAFDRNGYLFISLGDRQVPPEGDLAAHPAQNLANHFGKIIRVHDDGRVPADNPFVAREGALPQTWSYGHRNVQGMTIHPETGEVLATEHGPQGGDEVNIVQAGKNYGWPVIGFGVNYTTGTAIHSGTMKAGMEQPIHVWVPSIGTSGLMYYTGNAFPEWKGSLFAGGMAAGHLVRLTMNGRAVTDVERLVRGIGRVRDVRQGPDGFIYLAIEDRAGGKTPIVRIEPAAR